MNNVVSRCVFPVKLLFSLLLLTLFSGCANSLFYMPDRTVYQTPSNCGLKYEEVSFSSLDGTKLSGWFIPATKEPVGTVIHFHGNAQNMTAHFSFVDWLPAQGFNVFVFDYRGYGKSGGTPDRDGLYNDSLAAVQYVCRRKDVDRNKLCVLGQSLGGANAIAVLGENRFNGVKAVAIDSAFYSYRSIARDKISDSWLLALFKWPISFFATDNNHSPSDSVASISPTPLLFIHSTKDEVVPVHHSAWLFEAAGNPKLFLKVDGGNHLSAFSCGVSAYRTVLVDFFRNALQDKE